MTTINSATSGVNLTITDDDDDDDTTSTTTSTSSARTSTSSTASTVNVAQAIAIANADSTKVTTSDNRTASQKVTGKTTSSDPMLAVFLAEQQNDSVKGKSEA